MDPAKKQHMTVGVWVGSVGEGVKVNAVMDGGSVREVGVAISLADCHVMHPIVVGAIGGQDVRIRKPVNCRHHRGGNEPAPHEGKEVEVVVDEVELVGLFEDPGDVQCLEHLDVVGSVLLVSPLDNRSELGSGSGVTRGVEGHVDAELDQPVGQGRDDLFPGSVLARRSAPGDGRQHCHAHYVLPGVWLDGAPDEASEPGCCAT